MKEIFSNAFVYMFKQDKWGQKLGWLFFVLLAYFCASNHKMNYYLPIPFELAVKIIIGVSAILFYLYYQGYIIKLTNNLITKNSEEILPTWRNHFLDFFVLGLKEFVAGLLLVLAFIGPIVALIVVFAFALGFFMGGNLLLAKSITTVFAILLLIAPSVLVSLIFLALKRVFCETYDVLAYFKWGEALKHIKKAPAYYMLTILGMVVIKIIQFVAVATFAFFVMSLKFDFFVMLFTSAIATYFAPVIAYLVAHIGQANNEVEAEIAQEV